MAPELGPAVTLELGPAVSPELGPATAPELGPAVPPALAVHPTRPGNCSIPTGETRL